MFTWQLNIKVRIFLLTGLTCCFSVAFAYQLPREQNLTTADTIIKFPAQPAKGFNYAYFVRIPKGVDVSKKQFLLVETNNTGDNDTLEFHEKGAYSEAKRYSLGASLCPGLKLPFLVPAFPRPQTEWKYYTHALDRDVVMLKNNTMERLDLQLIAMIKDAGEQLLKMQLSIHEKILMTGFSASGTFANRFTLIHPEIVAGVACGGINAMPILPVKKIGSAKLIYPVGIYDYVLIFNDSVHSSSYKEVPQYIYMGAKDSNDAVLFDDAYGDKERKIIYRKLGKIMQPDRWKKVQSIYAAESLNVIFKTYPTIGHETDREVYQDVRAFFRNIIQQYN